MLASRLDRGRPRRKYAGGELLVVNLRVICNGIDTAELLHCKRRSQHFAAERLMPVQ